jgi:hypothetical protein
MSEAQTKPKRPQHVPLTAERLKELWAEKLITSKGYVQLIIELKRSTNIGLKIQSVPAFCQEWGIAESTFYKAVHGLTSDKKIYWKATGGMEIWRLPKSAKVVEFPSTIVESESLIIESESTIVEFPSTIIESESTIVENRSPEAATVNAFSPPTDLYRSNTDPLADRLQERELTRAREKEAEPVADDPPLRSQVADDSLTTQPTIGEDQSSAPLLNEKNFEGFDFEHFRPDSNLNYWEWAYSKCADLKRFREAAKHPNPIGDVAAYTLGCIKRRGVAGFKAYLIEIGVLPPEISQMAAVSETRAAQRAAPDAWQKSNSNLQVVCERDGVDGVIDRLKLLLAGTNTPSDPDRVRWLIEQNPQWRLQFRDGRVERTDQSDRADCSDYTALIPAYIRQLQLTKENLEMLLEERYGVRRRSALDEAQLKDFAQFLSEWAGGASCAS